VQSTSVDPSANVLPDAGVQVTDGFVSWSSVAVAGNVTAAPLGPVASAVIPVGRESVGGVASRCPASLTVRVVSVVVGGMVKLVGARWLPAGGVIVPVLAVWLVVVGSQRSVAWPLLWWWRWR